MSFICYYIWIMTLSCSFIKIVFMIAIESKHCHRMLFFDFWCQTIFFFGCQALLLLLFLAFLLQQFCFQTPCCHCWIKSAIMVMIFFGFLFCCQSIVVLALVILVFVIDHYCFCYSCHAMLSSDPLSLSLKVKVIVVTSLLTVL